jgi:hypothetical protein
VSTPQRTDARVITVDRETADAESFEVPLTYGLVEQLIRRRYDLAMTNVDHLPDDNGPISPETLAEITVNRLACGALHRVIGAYTAAVARTS